LIWLAMLQELLLALGLPLLLLLITVLALQHPDRPLAIQLQRLAGAAPRLVPIGFGLVLSLSLLRWLLQR
jgi:hypothetical protein